MGDAQGGRSDLIRRNPAALVLGAVVLTGCSPTLGAELGGGRLVADEAVYPGEAGPLLGEVATSQDEVDELWDTLRLPDTPPTLGASVLVIVAGGEPEDCPWRLGEVSVDHDAEVAIDLPWDARSEPTPTRSVDERPDPELWAERMLSVDDLSVTSDLPIDGATVTMLSGSDITADLCCDIVERHRPLVAGRWVAASGHIEVDVRVEDRSAYGHPLATVVLRDVTLDPIAPAEGEPWRIEELRLTDAPIGGFAG
jgi:hypothetical protein